jgi:peptidoglycan-N-acetylmuramic acid deacetylase
MKHCFKGAFCRIGCIILALASGLFALPGTVAATDTTPYNWYCKNNSTHTPPTLDSDQRWIEDYDGYYLDHSVKKGDKVIYLTFDAGYENGNVEKILDALKAHKAPGAFFILDNLMVRNGDLVKRMANEGHLVCNHTKRHPDMTKICDRKTFAEQLTTLAEHYKELTGKEMPKIYRPPEGRYSRQNLQYAKAMGYKTVFWSFAYADWDNNRQMSEEAALKKILDHTHNGEILLLHPTSATNAAIMDRLLTALENEGYRFGKLTELWD